MSRRTLRVGLVLWVTNASALAAQQAPDLAERERELVERLERLDAHYRELSEAGEVLRQMRHTQVRKARAHLDTVPVGPFLVIAPVDQIPEARDVYGYAWGTFEEIAAGWSLPREADGTNLLPFQRANGNWLPGAQQGVRVRPWHSPTATRQRAASVVGRRLFEYAAPANVRMWTPNFAISEPEALTYAYRNLVLTPNSAAHACFEGNSDRCWDALGARDAEDGWTEWYEANERRARVEEDEGALNDAHAGLRDRCLRGEDDSCVVFLKSRLGRAPIPLHAYSRASLLAHALLLGGEGALLRLAEGPADRPVRDRLIHASGMDGDDLIDSWREVVLEARPPTKNAMTFELLTGGLLWSLVLSGLAMRSTRWRI